MAQPTIADDPWALFFVLYAVSRAGEKASLDMVRYRCRCRSVDFPQDLQYRHMEAEVWNKWLVREAALWCPSFKVTLKPDGTVKTFEYA